MHTTITKKRIAVIGIGRIGLPFALFFAKKGFLVFGIDKNLKLVRKCKLGVPPFKLELSNKQFRAIVGKNFFPTTDYSFCRGASYLIIAVGSSSGGNKGDVFAVRKAMFSLIPFLQAGQTILIRSTLSPGTTKKISGLIQKKTHWKIGRDIFLAYCPERGLEGKIMHELPLIPQLIGADDPMSIKKAKDFFRYTGAKLLVSNSIAVALAKIFSNIYRYADFAVSNTCMMIAEESKQNIHEIIKLVNSGYNRALLKPPGFTGGPCLPKAPFLLPSVFPASQFLYSMHSIHKHMPYFIVRQLKKIVGKNLNGLKIAVLGVTFKGDTDDMRASLALKLVELLKQNHCRVYMHDPFVFPKTKLGNILRKVDAIVICAPHKFYSNLTPHKLKQLTSKEVIICDPMGIVAPAGLIYKI